MIGMRALLTCSSAAALAVPAVADAQSAPTAAAAVPEPVTGVDAEQQGLQDIVVTAQKREESLQSTAAAVQVIGAARLVDRGVTDITRLTSQTTGFIIQPSRQSVIIFSRGLGQSDAQSQTPVAVEVQLDGLTLPKNAQQFALFDVANVQALKGPQGVLYGRNAVGGAVLINSKRPTFDGISAEGFFEGGNYDLVHFFAAANLPFSDTFAIRAALDYINHDGYMSNGSLDANTMSGRLSLAWRPTDRLSVFLAGTFSTRQGHGYSVHVRPFDTAANGDEWFVTPVPTSGVVGVANFNDPRNRGYDRQEAYLITGEVDYSITDDVKMTYVGGYNNYSGDQLNASGLRPNGIFQSNNTFNFREDTQDIQNEVRLSYDRDKLRAVVGALQHKYETPNSSLQLAYHAGPIANGPLNFREFNYAVFGNVEIPVTDSLRIEGGVRQSWDRKAVTGTLSGSPVVLDKSNFPEWKHLSWKIGAQYDVATDILLYANVQDGYLPGSFQSASIATLTGLNRTRRYDDVKLKAYTAGFKSSFFDNRLRLNAEGFYYDYRNFQVNQRLELVVNGVAGFQNVYANIRKSRIFGLDVDATARVVKGGTLSVGVGLLNAKIRNTGFTQLAILQNNGRFVNAADPSLHGFTLPNSPKFTLNLGYEQQFELASGAKIIGNVATHHESSKWLDYTHPDVALALQASQWKTDVSLTYRTPNNRFSFSVWGRNLEDTATYSGWGGNQLRQGGVIVGSYSQSYIDAPRTYGVRAGFSL